MAGQAMITRDLMFNDVSENLRVPLAVAHPYIPPLSTVIFTYKDNQIPELSHFLADLLSGAIEQILLNSDFPSSNAFLIPVPTRSTSLKQRGFDPLGLIAHHLVKQGYRSIGALTDQRNSGRSKALNIAERKHAAHNAFRLTDESVTTRLSGHQAIVIDDVTTTGATLREACELLMHSGIHVIGCASIAGSRKRS
jgi:ComF family protein